MPHIRVKDIILGLAKYLEWEREDPFDVGLMLEIGSGRRSCCVILRNRVKLKSKIICVIISRLLPEPSEIGKWYIGLDAWLREWFVSNGF